MKSAINYNVIYEEEEIKYEQSSQDDEVVPAVNKNELKVI